MRTATPPHPPFPTCGFCCRGQVLTTGPLYARYMKAVKAHSKKELEAVTRDPSLASFRKDLTVPSVTSVTHLAPCLELMYDGRPYLVDVIFAFTTAEVAALAAKNDRLTPTERAPLVNPAVYLFVHWHEWVAPVEPLALPAKVTYLGSHYSILLASDVKDLGLIRRVHVVPQLGDLELVVPRCSAAKALSTAERSTSVKAPYFAGLPCVEVLDASGRLVQVRRRLALSGNPTLYVGLMGFALLVVCLFFAVHLYLPLIM